MLRWSWLVIAALLCHHFSSDSPNGVHGADLSCKDHNGNVVDWWLISSMPHAGGGYWISTSLAQEPKYIHVKLDDCRSAYRRTLRQQARAGVGNLIYTSERPLPPVASQAMAAAALAKVPIAGGVLMWETGPVPAPPNGQQPQDYRPMGTSALWITSSCSKWDFPANGNIVNDGLHGDCFQNHNHHFQCVTFNPAAATPNGGFHFGTDIHGMVAPPAPNPVPNSYNWLHPDKVTQLEVVALHLQMRKIRVVRHTMTNTENGAVKRLYTPTNARMAQIAAVAANGVVDLSANEDAALLALPVAANAVRYAYFLRAQLSPLNRAAAANVEPFTVFSRRAGQVASVWDDIIVPYMTTVANGPAAADRIWSIATHHSAEANFFQPLPCVCYKSGANAELFDEKTYTDVKTGVIKSAWYATSCRIRCHPRRFVLAMEAIRDEMDTKNNPKICGGMKPTDEDPNNPNAHKQTLYALSEYVTALLDGPTEEKFDHAAVCVTDAKWNDDATNAAKIRAAALAAPGLKTPCLNKIRAVRDWGLVRAPTRGADRLYDHPGGTVDVKGVPKAVTDSKEFNQVKDQGCTHAKIGWTTNNDGLVCTADLNREGGLNLLRAGDTTRGGGGICWYSPLLTAKLETLTKVFQLNAANSAIVGPDGAAIPKDYLYNTNLNATASSPPSSLSSSLSSVSAPLTPMKQQQQQSRGARHLLATSSPRTASNSINLPEAVASSSSSSVAIPRRSRAAAYADASVTTCEKLCGPDNRSANGECCCKQCWYSYDDDDAAEDDSHPNSLSWHRRRSRSLY